jgi:hypothetical protein
MSKLRKKILFIIGTLNQTTQMHQIASFLEGHFDCYFSQMFSSHWAFDTVIRTGILNHTLFAGRIKLKADRYLVENDLKNDYRCRVYKNNYDLVVVCTDMMLPKNLRGIKTVWVQEGMIDNYNLLAKIVKTLKLPPVFAMSTALNGSSNECDIYCAGSNGYKNYLSSKGTDIGKIAVTGIPNYDHLNQYLHNDFVHRDYVFVATSDIRETFRFDNRVKFIKHAVELAAGRPLIFKLHPNEKKRRAIAEIKKHTPAGTLIYSYGNTNHMIANCSELITQYSTVVFVGIALGKKVHSYFDVRKLKRLMPLQNDGVSAESIAAICGHFIYYKGSGAEFLKEHNQVKLNDNTYISHVS